MSKAEKLQNHLKSADEPKKWKAYVVVAVGVLVGVGLMFGGLFLLSPIVDTYLHDTKQIVVNYDFLDLKKGDDATVVYFVGSSIVGCGIDSDEINRILNEKGYNITTYNLGIDADNPLERSLQIQKIIDSNPALVILGESYSRIGTLNFTDEHILLINERITVPEENYYLQERIKFIGWLSKTSKEVIMLIFQVGKRRKMN